MAVPPPHSDKAALRTALRRARRDLATRLGPVGLAEAEAAIAAALSRLVGRDGVLAGYLAAGGEPSVTTWLTGAAQAGRVIALPRIGTDRTLSFAAWQPGDPLVGGPLGIAQPAAAAPSAVPTVLLVPLVGFDRSGARLGQGAGYYDRWFAAHPGARRIGVAWSVQEIAALPVDAWDVPLHAIITEREVIAP